MLCLAAAIGLSACQNIIDEPTLSCPEMVFNFNTEGKTTPLNLSSSLLFRAETDSGGQKYVSIEGISDSMKVIINLFDGMYVDSLLSNDSIRLKTYTYSRKAKVEGGLIIIGTRVPGFDYHFLETDTSSITITRINTRKKTITGYYYYANTGNTVTGQGVFQNTCYSSLSR
ncbi:hypothetical protein SAMN05444266_107449 [Chitinophaga jiangningensis]|uniref:Uncharacterized protein n=1 Tax=Chitinophaga jiangningensis TaxID=1419482 RepID=A0A1M7HZU7_9BACT|nr:hypothetical protein [Chitinophaga jiangningensis]SHM33995.1 hypothetical protein SAMN05444266_107449 [Chitinophaga jiangningensis]